MTFNIGDKVIQTREGTITNIVDLSKLGGSKETLIIEYTKESEVIRIK